MYENTELRTAEPVDSEALPVVVVSGLLGNLLNAVASQRAVESAVQGSSTDAPQTVHPTERIRALSLQQLAVLLDEQAHTVRSMAKVRDDLEALQSMIRDSAHELGNYDPALLLETQAKRDAGRQAMRDESRRAAESVRGSM